MRWEGIRKHEIEGSFPKYYTISLVRLWINADRCITVQTTQLPSVNENVISMLLQSFCLGNFLAFYDCGASYLCISYIVPVVGFIIMCLCTPHNLRLEDIWTFPYLNFKLRFTFSQLPTCLLVNWMARIWFLISVWHLIWTSSEAYLPFCALGTGSSFAGA
jgi:hypothetical protein